MAIETEKTRIEEYKKKIEALESGATQRDDWLNRISHYAIPTLYNYKYDQTNYRSNLPDDVYDCFDEETEVLTNNGWKYFDEVSINDKVLSMCPENLIADYYHIDEIIIQDFKGKLKYFKHRDVEFFVTENHKMFHRNRETNNWNLKPIKDISVKSYALKRDFIWSRPDRDFITIGDKDYLFDDWAKFLGWFISEGFTYTEKKEKKYWVTITQSKEKNPEKCAEIEDLLSRLGFANRQYSGMNYRFGSKNIVKHLDEVVGKGAVNKRIPQYIRDASKRQIDLFLDAFRKGDGYIDASGSRCFNTSSRMLAADTQECIIKLGAYASVSTIDNIGREKWYKDHFIKTKNLHYEIREFRKNAKTYDTYINSKKVSDVYYDGKIYCVTTSPYHLIYVRRNGKCFWSGNSEMVQSGFEFANLLYSFLTNPASKWVQIDVGEELAKVPGVKDSLEAIDKTVMRVLAQSNFYSSIHSSFHQLISGNCVIYREKDPKDIVRYRTIPLSECYFEYDKSQRINSMYRKVRKTPLQLIEEFPDTVSEKVRQAAKTNSSQQIKCVHIVRPRWQRDIDKKDEKNKAYESVWIDLENNTILSESGYDKFPYFVGHYMRDPFMPYSWGPAHLCFYDAKSLNQLVLSNLRRAAKEADPVVNLPSDGYILPYLQDPGSVNYRTSDDPKDKAEYMMPPPASVAVNTNIEDMRAKIKRAFFVDLYRSVIDATKRMTTVEVQQRIADRAPMLGPAIWNLTKDFIDLIIEDLIEILAERGELPALPPDLEGQSFTFKYLSPLARAQQVSEFQSLQAFLLYLQSATQFTPDVVDNIDFDKYTRIAADATGAPQEIVREEPDVKKVRKERNQAIAAQQQRQEIMQAASAAKDASTADKNLANVGQQ